MKLNDTYFAMAQYNNPNERAHVMCQEIGHTLGLAHTSEDGSSQSTCMDYSQSPSSRLPTRTTTPSCSRSTPTSTPPPRSARPARLMAARSATTESVVGT